MSTNRRKRAGPSRWKYRAGRRGCSVIVEERRGPGGPVHAKTWSSQADRYIKRSLGFRVRNETGELIPKAVERAERFAEEQSLKLRTAESELEAEKATLGRVLDLYSQNRTPGKSAREQKADARRIAMWTAVLGRDFDPHHLSRREWDAFLRARTEGSIDARGQPVPEGKRKPVRAGTAAHDAAWLRQLLGWAAGWRLPNGRFLLTENPARGLKAKDTPSPRREVMTDDRIEKIREVADRVRMTVRWNGKPETTRSHFGDVFELATHTGRRLSAILKLRYADVRTERSKAEPHGSILWRAENDKGGREQRVPLNAAARAAVDRILRERPGIADGRLFPSPGDPSQPVTRHLMDKHFRKAEKLAELEPQPGTLWHALRRRWVSVRKHLPATDVAAAGGWASVDMVQRVYTRSDPTTTLEVVLGGGELREVR